MQPLLNISSSSLLQADMAALPISFRFLGALIVGASVLSVANSKRELGLLTGTFLIGLSALEIALHVAGV